MRCILLAALAAAFVPAFPSALVATTAEVQAGTVTRFAIEDLVQRSDQAFEGRVVSCTTRVGARGRIETEYGVRVARAFVGTGGTVRTFRLPGGTLPDGSGMIVPGMPRLSQGEDVLVFLTAESASGSRMPVGLAQGKLRVVTAADGRKSLVRDVLDLEIVEVRGAQGPGRIDPPTLDYASTITRIEAAVAARAAAKSKAGAR